MEKIRQYRAEGREIFYMDETYANANYVEQKMWSDMSLTNMLEVKNSKPKESNGEIMFTLDSHEFS